MGVINVCYPFLYRASNWQEFVRKVQLLGENSSALRRSKVLKSVDLSQLISNRRFGCSYDSKVTPLRISNAIVDFGSLASYAGLCHGASLSSLWLPLDLVFEDAMDGYQVNPTSAIEIITGNLQTPSSFTVASTKEEISQIYNEMTRSKFSGLAKTLKEINGSTWHDTFLGLWIAALRLVQRVRLISYCVCLIYMWSPNNAFSFACKSYLDRVFL